MAYWYKINYYTLSVDHGLSNPSFSDNDFIGFKKLYNNVLYGTASNPLWSMQISRTNLRSYQNGVAFLNGYTDTGRGTSVGAFLNLWNKAGLLRRGYPTIFYSNTPYTEYTEKNINISELPTTTIAGKYRLRPALATFNSACWSSIPVNFSLKGVTYNNIGFSNVKIPWYVSHTMTAFSDDSSTDRKEVWSTLFNVNATSMYLSTSRNSPVISVYRDDTITNTSADMVYLTDNYPDNFAGEVIDFGDVPQEVPTIFAEWLLNSADIVYPYNYIIKSYNGETTLASILDAPKMTSAFITTIGNTKILTLIGSNGETYSRTWESDTPEGYIFLGLSNSPRSARVVLPVNSEREVNWEGDLIFYDSYGKYRPPATTFDINLYQNSAEVNRVDKEQFIVGVGTLSGALRDECSMLTPSIVYQSESVPTFNYVYIPIFNRYYFVTSLSSVSKNVWRMELNCDVLMSYKNEILLLQGVVGRQEIDFNPLLVDNELPTQNNPIVEVIDIPSDAFNTRTSDGGHNFLLTVIGA